MSASPQTSIKVTVKFLGLARKAGPGPAPDKGVVLDLPEGILVNQLLARFGLTTHRNIIMVGKDKASWDTVIKDGDTVQIVGPPGGG